MDARKEELIAPNRVRYIKLGEGGRWAEFALQNSVNCIGFGAQRVDRFAWCQARQWDQLAESFVAEGRSRPVATRFVREVRTFFEDDGSVLWITFIGEWLYWGFAEPSTSPRRRPDLDGVCRPIRGGWRCRDLRDEPLTKDRLSGGLTQLTGFRGTSCDVGEQKDYVVRRINGQTLPQVEHAIAARAELETAVLGLMKLLTPRDFETLVDLVFSESGWRRLGVVGGTETDA
jgi:hypothetical protein